VRRFVRGTKSRSNWLRLVRRTALEATHNQSVYSVVKPRPILDTHEDEAGHQVTKEEEFIHLLMVSYRSMYSYARTLVPSAADAEECVQEASLRLWQKFHEFDRDESFSRWARGFVRRVVKNFHRKKRPGYTTLDDDLIEKLAATQGGSQELLDLRREFLESCLKRLPQNDRKLIHSYYELGESIAALSRRLGRSQAAIYQAIHRTRVALFMCVDRSLKGGD